MFDLLPLQCAPSNLSDYVGEILPGFREIYGPEAADHYELAGATGMAASIVRSDVLAFGCASEGVVCALLLAKRENTRTTLSFLHVLQPFRRSGAGEALLNFALESLGQHHDIFTEFILFHPMELDNLFRKRGFAMIERQLMCCPTASQFPSCPGKFEFTHPEPADLHALAEVLTNTYRGHPERFLFPEVQSESQALDYLLRAAVGQFGRHGSTHTLAAWKDGQCAGFGIGCQVLPGVGFVLHLAVDTTFQGSGLGTSLLQGLSAAFADEALDYIALGVTCDNPAVKLYQRAGFRVKTRIPVYYRLAGAFEGLSPSDHPKT